MVKTVFENSKFLPLKIACKFFCPHRSINGRKFLHAIFYGKNFEFLKTVFLIPESLENVLGQKDFRNFERSFYDPSDRRSLPPITSLLWHHHNYSFRITPTSLLPSLMPLPTNSKPLKFKVSQPSNFSQLEEKCKTTTEAELLMISSNSLNQKELPKWVHFRAPLYPDFFHDFWF